MLRGSCHMVARRCVHARGERPRMRTALFILSGAERSPKDMLCSLILFYSLSFPIPCSSRRNQLLCPRCARSSCAAWCGLFPAILPDSPSHRATLRVGSDLVEHCHQVALLHLGGFMRQQQPSTTCSLGQHGGASGHQFNLCSSCDRPSPFRTLRRKNHWVPAKYSADRW